MSSRDASWNEQGSHPQQPQQGQQPQQSQQGQQQPRLTQQASTEKSSLLRVEQIRGLPHLNDTQKLAWESAVRGLYEALDRYSQDTAEYQQALTKLVEATNSAVIGVRRFQQQMQLQQQQQRQREQHQGSAPEQSSQTMAANGGQVKQPTSQSGQLPVPALNHGQAGQQPQGAPQAAPSLAQLPPAITQQIQAFQFQPPPSLTAGSAEAEKWLADTKWKYGQALYRLEGLKGRMQQLQGQWQAQTNAGKQFSHEEQNDFNQKRLLIQRTYGDTKGYVDNFRKEQQELRTYVQSRMAGAGATGGAAMARAGSFEGARPANQGQQQPPGAATQLIQQPTAPPGGPVKQPVESSMEASQDQRGADVPTSTSPTGVASGQVAATTNNKQTPTTAAVSPVTAAGTTVQNVNMASSTFQNIPRPVNAEATVNATPRLQPQQPHTSHVLNSPQPAQPAQPTPNTPLEPAQPLSQQAALSEAARSHSNRGSSPGVTTKAMLPDSNVAKMPIPKTINTQPPQPVAVNPARPTYSGGAGSAGNMVVNQPVLAKMPTFVLEGEGERVLSKKKLDELVKQVVGNGDGLGGELLTPECEEVSTCSLFPTSRLDTVGSFIYSTEQRAVATAAPHVYTHMPLLQPIEFTHETLFFFLSLISTTKS